MSVLLWYNPWGASQLPTALHTSPLPTGPSARLVSMMPEPPRKRPRSITRYLGVLLIAIALLALAALQIQFESTLRQTPPTTAAAEDMPNIPAAMPRCPAEKTDRSSSIVYGVLTGRPFHRTRVRALQDGWARHIANASIVFYSDADDPAVPTVRLTPPANERLLQLGAWRNFPGLMHLHDHYPDKEWFFFVDDDTFVFPRNFEALVSRLDARKPHYLGLYHTPRADLEWKEVHLAYASGGAGYVLSRPLLERARAHMDECHKKYVGWAGDIRVGKCLLDVGAAVEGQPGMHHEPPAHYTWSDQATTHVGASATALRQPPVTFHHLSAEQFDWLEAAHRVVDVDAHTGRVWEYDFSRLMLHEFDAYDAHAKSHGRGWASLRFLFGFRVDTIASERYDARPPLERRWEPTFDSFLSFERLPTAGAAAAAAAGAGAVVGMAAARMG